LSKTGVSLGLLIERSRGKEELRSGSSGKSDRTKGKVGA